MQDEEKLIERLDALTNGRLDATFDDEQVTVSLSRSDVDYPLSHEEFLKFLSEAESLKIDKENRFIRTDFRTFCIVYPESNLAEVIAGYNPQSFSIPVGEGITIGFRPNSLLVGVAALRKNAYEKHYQSPDGYPSIEISYDKPERRLSTAVEEQTVDMFLFQMAASDGVCFSKSALNLEAGVDPYYEYEGKEFKPSFGQLEAFSESMNLYLAASAVKETELRYLSFYKVIEYFGPVVFRLERNEALRKKLDSPEARKPDAEFLESLHSLMASFKERFSDERIPQAVIEKCVDFIDLLKLLPPSLTKALTYESSKQEVENGVRAVGLAMYATRNKVAHAKSNYRKTGGEVAGGELEQFTKFVEAVALRVIQWYNRLPEHLKTTFN
jgi:hypothetical protein